MAFFHVDSTGGSDANNGTTWALAKQTLTGAFSASAAGDTIFLRDSTTGFFLETSASSDTYTTTGSSTLYTSVFGVLQGTTNEGANVVAADITDRTSADAAELETTGTASALTIASAGGCHFEGMVFDVGFSLVIDTNLTIKTFRSCEFQVAENTGGSAGLSVGSNGSQSSHKAFFEDCEFIGTNIPQYHIIGGSVSEFVNCVWSGAWNTAGFFDSVSQGTVILRGCDFSAVTGSNLDMLDGGDNSPINFMVENCTFPTGMSMVSTTLMGEAEVITGIASDDATDHTSPIPDYSLDTRQGSVTQETTIVRTGGGSDGVNSISYNMTAGAATRTAKLRNSLKSPWLTSWLDGSETTIDVYIMEQTASATLDNSELWLEVLTPNEGVGTATSKYRAVINKATVVDEVTNWTAGDGSTWGGGGSQTKWKLSTTIAPEYAGPIKVRVHYAPESTQPIFIDSKLGIS